MVSELFTTLEEGVVFFVKILSPYYYWANYEIKKIDSDYFEENEVLIYSGCFNTL